MLPELAQEIDDSFDAMMLWTEIAVAFEKAYDEPRDESLIKRVYLFSRWCLEQETDDPAANHLPTCAIVCFYEHLPTRASMRDDMPRWFTRRDVLGMEAVFKYFLDPGEFEKLLEMFPANQNQQPPGWTSESYG